MEAHGSAGAHPDQKQTVALYDDNLTPSSVFLLHVYAPLEFSSFIPKGHLIQIYRKHRLSTLMTKFQDLRRTISTVAVKCGITVFLGVEETGLSEGLILMNHDLLFHEHSSYHTVEITATVSYKI